MVPKNTFVFVPKITMSSDGLLDKVNWYSPALPKTENG